MGSGDEEEALILQFLDSMDAYVSLHNLLSSTLRQGWLELASARHSMGSSRISSALYDLKEHQASSIVQINEVEGASMDENLENRPQFTMVKWGSYEYRHHPGDSEVKNELQCHLDSPKTPNLRHRVKDSFGSQQTHAVGSDPLFVNTQVEKQRSKSLSVFGALVSPKLRSAQLSFETALETIVKIANAQSTMQSAFVQIQRNKIQPDPDELPPARKMVCDDETSCKSFADAFVRDEVMLVGSDLDAIHL